MENIEEINILMLIILGCLGMFILAISIVLFIVTYNKRVLQQQHQIQEEKYRHQKELIEATIRVEEREREKIAKNIHDDLGALLNVMRLNNISAIKKIEDKTSVLKTLENNKELLNSTSEIVRSVAKQLAPPTLLKLGYVEGIKELARQLNNTESLKVAVDFRNITTRLDQKIEVQLYRITSEVVNNILKHASASAVQIDLTQVEGAFILTIAHNGIGISSEKVEKLTKKEGGLGLKSIQTRVQSINASIQYLISEAAYSKIMLYIPLTDEKN